MRSHRSNQDEANVPLLGPRCPDDDHEDVNDRTSEEVGRPRDSLSDSFNLDQDFLESETLLSSTSANSEADDETDTDTTVQELDPPPRYDSPSPPRYARTLPIFALKNKSSSNNEDSRKAFENATRRSMEEFDVEFQPLDKDFDPAPKKPKPFPTMIGRLIILVGLFFFGWFVGGSIVQKLIHRGDLSCPARYADFRDYQIQSVDHFELSNSAHQNSGLPKDFSGTLNILSGPSDQTVDLNVRVYSAKTDLKGDGTGADWRPLSLSCGADVTLYFRPGLEIKTLQITSKKLKLVLSTDLVVTEKTIITLKEGSVFSERFENSRETYIKVKKSKIGGTFGLREVLSIKKKKGSSSFAVRPMAAFKGRSKPAVLEVENESGSLDIDYQGGIQDLPDRKYRTKIISKSGVVKGKILHGKDTSIALRSGTIDIQILPIGREASTLTTTMESGVSTLEILAPVNGNTIKHMSSSHKSRSGSLELRYPEEWAGRIDGEARSGTLTLSGHDVTVLEQRVKGGSRYFKGNKGQGSNKLYFRIDSGGVDAVIGRITV